MPVQMKLLPGILSLLLLAGCPPTPQDSKATDDSTAPTDSGGEGGGDDSTASADNCPRLSLSSLSLYEKSAAVGEDNLLTLTVTNNCTGDVPLVVTPTLSADASTTFAITGERVTVPPGISQDITVTFTPQDFEAYIGDLEISSNDPINALVSIPLYGQATSDSDEDGYLTPLAGGDDCDDSDASIYPDAPDTWYDGIDSNCEGDDDYDKDTDGFQSDEYGGDDCDDTDDQVYPDAKDTWYDGVDSDCTGNSDYDKDKDGQDSEDYGGADCDDTDDDIYYGADDTPYDGVDGDCNDDSDYDADHDGEDGEDYGGADCDDDDATVYSTADDVDDDVDNDCDGRLDEDDVAEWDLLVVEVMPNPTEESDAYGEYFEIYNAGSSTIDLYGWKIVDDTSDTFTITSHLKIKGGNIALFAAEDDESLNGGITPHYTYDRTYFKLDDNNDEVYLTVEGRTIGGVHYKTGFDIVAGASLNLDLGHFDATAEDADNWCAATTAYNGADLGSPGTPNELCD